VRFKGTTMSIKGAIARFKDSTVRFKGTTMSIKGAIARFKNSTTRFQDSLIRFGTRSME